MYTRAQRTHRDHPQQECAADRVAAEVVSRLAQPAAPTAQGGEADVDAPPLAVQRRASAADTVGTERGSMPASVEHETQSARSGGSQLDPATRAPMERASGADFGSVRVQSGALQDAFIKEMEGMSIAQLEKASKDIKRSQFERIVLSEALGRKIKEEMKAKAGK